MPTDPVERIYFDANVFIYAMETDTERGILARRWFRTVDRGDVQAVTSELTLAEVLPHPIAAGDDVLVKAYHRLLEHRPSLHVTTVDRTVILRAAELRALSKTSLPDTLHLATAIEMGCTGFLTEDERLRPPEGLKKLSLADVRAS